MLTISASHEKEGTVLKLLEREVRYWAGLAARDIRLASCELEEVGYIAGDASEESLKLMLKGKLVDGV